MSRTPTAITLSVLALMTISVFAEHMAGTDGVWSAYVSGLSFGVFVGVILTRPRPE